MTVMTLNLVEKQPAAMRRIIGKHLAVPRWQDTCDYYNQMMERERLTVCFHAQLSGIKTASVTASDSVTATVPVVTVKASTRVTLDTPEVVCTNKLTTGTLEVQKGGTMRGNIEHTGGELSSNGKVLHTHKHPGDSGGTTGSPL